MARRKNWLASSLIALMRLHYQQGHSIKELARVYRVHPSVAANICHGRTHRRVVAADPSDGISLEDVARRMGVTERSPEKEGRRRRLAVKQVAQIRAHYQKGRRISELAEAFDLHPNVVANICHGRTHQRVPAAEGREIRPLPRRRHPKQSRMSSGESIPSGSRTASAMPTTAPTSAPNSGMISYIDLEWKLCPECSKPVASFADFQVHVMAEHPDKEVPKPRNI